MLHSRSVSVDWQFLSVDKYAAARVSFAHGFIQEHMHGLAYCVVNVVALLGFRVTVQKQPHSADSSRLWLLAVVDASVSVS